MHPIIASDRLSRDALRGIRPAAGLGQRLPIPKPALGTRLLLNLFGALGLHGRVSCCARSLQPCLDPRLVVRADAFRHHAVISVPLHFECGTRNVRPARGRCPALAGCDGRYARQLVPAPTRCWRPSPNVRAHAATRRWPAPDRSRGASHHSTRAWFWRPILRVVTSRVVASRCA